MTEIFACSLSDFLRDGYSDANMHSCINFIFVVIWNLILQ